MSAVPSLIQSRPLHAVAPTAQPSWDPALLVFNEDIHAYEYDGVRVPSVTQLLDGLHSFAGVPWDVLEAAKERGTNVHLATQYFDEGDLDEATVSAQVRPYLEGWKRFVLDCEPNWRAIEQPLYHPGLRYAGTPDRFGEITLKGQRIDCQVDIKTALDAHPVWSVQTMAYNHAAGCPNARRFTCQLRPDGTYRLLEWADVEAWPVFMSLLTLRTWKARNGL